MARTHAHTCAPAYMHAHTHMHTHVQGFDCFSSTVLGDAAVSWGAKAFTRAHCTPARARVHAHPHPHITAGRMQVLIKVAKMYTDTKVKPAVWFEEVCHAVGDGLTGAELPHPSGFRVRVRVTELKYGVYQLVGPTGRSLRV